uniref:polynucleotide adenylyltransferase n=1 Tax=Strongyloides stercoralis TaxID=6248 RepID=A0AAF5I2M2_STRER
CYIIRSKLGYLKLFELSNYTYTYFFPNTNCNNKILISNVVTRESVTMEKPFIRSSIELNEKQLEKLKTVMRYKVEIHGKDSFPTIEVELHKLIKCVRRKLSENNINLKYVKMNGGAASYVLADEDFLYADLDLIFALNFSKPETFDKVKTSVFDALIEMMPRTINKNNLHEDILKDIYISKMVKVDEKDKWSLFSLYNNVGKCIELKFVDNMHRQFEFSVDSFQITLDSMLIGDKIEKCNDKVIAESMYGDIDLALYHLNNGLIETRSPEEIRGGGLLKYCYLLCRGNKATEDCKKLEKYMCSRFFIDFPDVQSQQLKLIQYVDNHFNDVDENIFSYLDILYQVILNSTVCLMVYDRKVTLSMIKNLKNYYKYSYGMSAKGYCEHNPQSKIMYIPNNGTANYWIAVE